MLAQVDRKQEFRLVDEKKSAGGHARALALSKEERSEIARHAALARHRKDLPKAIAEGVLAIGDLQIPCAVLDDGANTRLLTQTGFLKAIGRHPFARGGTGSALDDTAPFLRPNNLKPFISKDLERSSIPVQYLPRNPTAGAGGIGYGYKASLLPDVCWVYQDAMMARKLLKSQLHLGESARQFLKLLTNHAIDDLVDQATGFDDIRKYNAVIKLLEKQVSPDRLKYAKMFDTDFYRLLFRLNSWPFDPEKTARPAVLGHWMNNFYDRMTPGIRHMLHGKVKRNAKGRPTEKLTQYLTDKEGKQRLRELTEGIKAIGRISSDKTDFWEKMDVAYPKYTELELLPFHGGLPRLRAPSRSIPSASQPPSSQSPHDVPESSP
jgi:hypothetical protein